MGGTVRRRDLLAADGGGWAREQRRRGASEEKRRGHEGGASHDPLHYNALHHGRARCVDCREASPSRILEDLVPPLSPLK